MTVQPEAQLAAENREGERRADGGERVDEEPGDEHRGRGDQHTPRGDASQERAAVLAPQDRLGEHAVEVAVRDDAQRADEERQREEPYAAHEQREGHDYE